MSSAWWQMKALLELFTLVTDFPDLLWLICTGYTHMKMLELQKKILIDQSESFYFFCCKIWMNWATELCLVAFDQIFAGLFRGHLFLYVLCDNLATIQENMPDSYFGQDSNSCTLKNFSSVIQKRQISPWRVQ